LGRRMFCLALVTLFNIKLK